ncbi:protein kinase domain-containing protein [Endozoicomonas elysicola]|uniref:protein kinase domain-containing protein n=1 Tax=Endozoicomonas elysicola TaxID=305900 RepID=UPI0012FAF6B0|nr:protein kinase [Endozoicomonas elysicola]
MSRVKLEFTLIAKGADKQVFEAKNLNDRKVVVYTPVRKLFGLYSREAALKQEYQKTQEIKRSVSDSTHLAVDMKPLTGQDRIDDQFSLETAKAAGDLEATIQNKATTFGQRLDYCVQYLDGLMNLHGADMAHGDLKPENCLIYDDGSLKIADFGKTEKLPNNKTKMYKGNLRFCPPEGVLSIKSDVYGSALLIIRALEETGSVLDKNGCLLPIPEEDRESGVTGMGRGIDKYVVEHKEFLAIDSQSLAGKITKRLPRQIKLAHLPKTQQKEQRKLIVNYIKTLANKLHNQGYFTEKSAENLTQLLIDMTTRNPLLRITAREAFSRFKALQNDVGIEK